MWYVWFGIILFPWLGPCVRCNKCDVCDMYDLRRFFFLINFFLYVWYAWYVWFDNFQCLPYAGFTQKKKHYFLSPLWCDVGHMYDMHDFWSIIFIGLHRSRDSVFPVCQISPLPLSLNQSKGDWWYMVNDCIRNDIGTPQEGSVLLYVGFFEN